jgi:hypothetical protein
MDLCSNGTLEGLVVRTDGPVDGSKKAAVGCADEFFE